MPTPYEVLLARVKQKIATEADWLAIEDELGVIFAGEQAFVWSPDGTPVNFKIGDGTKKFSELPYFIAYMSGIANQKVLGYIDQNTNITISNIFKYQSFIQDVIFLNNSGADIDLKIGTTNGGNGILEMTVPNGPVNISTKYFFEDNETVYITGVDTLSFSIFIIYLQLNESPVAPNNGVSNGPSYGYGTLYEFLPMYPGHENVIWDFTSGLGKTGSGYDNCILLDYPDTYLKGYKTGDTLGGIYGNTTNNIAIAKVNLPPIQDKIYGQEQNKPTAGGGGGRQGIWVTNDAGSPKKNAGDVPYLLQELGGSSQAINIQPKSLSVLYFTGPQVTT